MALDPAISEQLTALILTGAKHSADQIGLAGTNLAQGLGVIHNVLIQQAGGVADDAAVMAALRTSVMVPHGDK